MEEKLRELNFCLPIITGFCTCSEGYTLIEELQDCIQFNDNGKTSSDLSEFSKIYADLKMSINRLY